MSVIAINVLLDPDAATVARAQALNARLRANFPHGFALDANHAPHITLLQRFVRRADLDAIAEAAKGVLRIEQSVDWTTRATGLYALVEGDLGLAGIVIEPTAALRRLQQRIVEAVTPFTVENGTGAAFAPRPDGAAISSATVDYVNTFVEARTGTRYHPHLTVGIGTVEFLDGLKAEPFQPFTVRAPSVSLYQLGDYGTAHTRLHELHRC